MVLVQKNTPALPVDVDDPVFERICGGLSPNKG
jgi:hypothetical protein